MDDSLSKSALALLQMAPLYFLFNGYWMLSNRQIFDNHWAYIMKSSDHMKSAHILNLHSFNWATHVELFALAGVLIFLLQRFAKDYLRVLGISMASEKDIEVEEGLPNFFEALKITSQDEVIKESENMKDNFKIEIEDPVLVERLKGLGVPNLTIQGTPWYNILSNPIYFEDFYYIGAHIDEREKLIKDGDDKDGNNTE